MLLSPNGDPGLVAWWDSWGIFYSLLVVAWDAAGRQVDPVICVRAEGKASPVSLGGGFVIHSLFRAVAHSPVGAPLRLCCG